MTIQASPSGTQPSSSSSSSNSQTLTLPAKTHAKLLPSHFLSAHLLSGTRPSARSPNSYRPATLHTGSLTHAHGSAVVRIGSSAAVCGVRAEILCARDTDLPITNASSSTTSRKTPDADRIAALGLLVPNVELNTGCNPAFLPGSAPGQVAQALTHRILGMLRVADLVVLEGLCIYEDDIGREDRQENDAEADTEATEREVKAYFTLYIDILFLSLSGPHSAFDIAWLAIQSALRNTRLPAARWDRDVDSVLCDPRMENCTALGVRGCSVALSWSVFTSSATRSGNGSRSKIENEDENKNEIDSVLLLDPDDFEESCCAEGGVVVVDFGSGAGSKDEAKAGTGDDNGNIAGRILRIENHGGNNVAGPELRGILDVARRRWQEWDALLR